MNNLHIKENRNICTLICTNPDVSTFHICKNIKVYFMAFLWRHPVIFYFKKSFCLLFTVQALKSSKAKDKDDFDEFNVPVLSPMGSMENLYESILPKHSEDNQKDSFNYYDPPTEARNPKPNVTTDGYLEPVTSTISNTTLTSTTSTAFVKETSSPIPSRSNSLKINYSRENSGSSLENNPNTNEDIYKSKLESKEETDVMNNSYHFIEPELTEERRLLLASQPIYEEIPYDEEMYPTKIKFAEKPPPEPKNSFKSQLAQAWLQHPNKSSKAPIPRPPPKTSSASSAMTTLTSSSTCSSSLSTVPPSPSHSLGRSPAVSVANLMAVSLTSSMLPPPPPPPDVLPAQPLVSVRSMSRETVSSESDSHSSCSTLSRPRPAPRRKPKRPDTGGSDQYVSMDKTSTQVCSLSYSYLHYNILSSVLNFSLNYFH